MRYTLTILILFIETQEGGEKCTEVPIHYNYLCDDEYSVLLPPSGLSEYLFFFKWEGTFHHLKMLYMYNINMRLP